MGPQLLRPLAQLAGRLLFAGLLGSTALPTHPHPSFCSSRPLENASIQHGYEELLPGLRAFLFERVREVGAVAAESLAALPGQCPELASELLVRLATSKS